MKSTKVFVFKLEQIIYTLVLIILAIALIFFLFSTLSHKNNQATETASYVPGVYTTSFYLDNQPIKVEVAVDSGHINSIKLRDLNDFTSELYPLLEPAMNTLESQIIDNQSIDKTSIDPSNPYTSSLLIKAIEETLQKATVK